MRILLRLTGLFCAATSPVHAGDTVFADGFDPSRWVQGYFVGYQRSLLAPEDVDFRAVTHLMIGRLRPLADGRLTRDFDIDDVQGPPWAASASAAAHAAGRKAILMIGGAGEIEGWRGAAATPQGRERLAAELQAAAEAFDADGFDLDWEPLDTGDRDDFLALVHAIRSRVPGAILTLPVGWINANFATPDPWWGEVAPLFDRINVMSYDMEWPADGWQSWHSSALHGESGTTPSSISSSVAFYRASGVPAAKLGIGSGFYGVCWRGVTEPRRDPGWIVGSDGQFSYATVVRDYLTPAARRWDADAHVPYLSSAAGLGPQGCTFLSYEDAQSLADKGAWAKAQGLGGLIVWTLAQGHLPDAPAGQRDPLLDAIRSGFLDGVSGPAARPRR